MHVHMCHIALWKTHYRKYFQTGSFSGFIVSADIPFFAPHNSAPVEAIFHGSSIRLGESYTALL